MKNVYIFFVFLLLININIVKADDNVYIKSDNIIKINNDYKITNTEKIISNILIDNNNIYYYSDKNFYIVNKTNGSINYKIFVSGLKNFSQTDNFVFLNDDINIYKINKSTGIIENKQLENNLIDNIYSLFGVSGISNNIINNYYNNSSNIYNNVSGTNNHANLTNLEISTSGHVFDSDIHFTIPNLNLFSYSNNSYGNIQDINSIWRITWLNPSNLDTSYAESGVNIQNDYSTAYMHSENDMNTDYSQIDVLPNNIIIRSSSIPVSSYDTILCLSESGSSLLKKCDDINTLIQINESQVNNLNTDLNNKWNKTDNINGSIDKNLKNYTNTYNWINNSTIQSDNLKVNKSGDTMTSGLLINDSIGKSEFTGAGMLTDRNIAYFGNKYPNQALRFTSDSLEFWNGNNTVRKAVFSDSNTEISFTNQYKMSILSGVFVFDQGNLYPSGFRFNTGAANGLYIDSSGNSIEKGTLTITSLSGSGTKNICVDNTGKIINSGCGVTQNISVLTALPNVFTKLEYVNGVLVSVT